MHLASREQARLRPAFAAALLGVAALTLFTAPSSAKSRRSGVHSVSSGVQGVGPTPANYDVSCPHGLKAVGGGFGSAGYVVSGSLVPGGGPVAAVVPVIFESRRLNVRTWRVSARAAVNPATASFGPNGTTITALAYCRKVKGRVRAVEGVGALSTTSSAPSTADPHCPKGAVALSGGWSITEDQGFAYPSLYESFRDGSRGWTSSAIPGTQPSVSLLGFVYCAKERKPPKTSRRTQANAPILVECPKRLVATAGGFQSQPGTLVNSSQNFASSQKKRGVSSLTTPAASSWFLSTGFPDGSQATTTAFAYCS